VASTELQLLSNIIKKGSLSEARRRGVTPDLFFTEEGRELFGWLQEEYADPRHHGVVPSLERVRRHFPDFDYRPSRDSIDALVTELLNQNVTVGFRELTEEMDALIEEGEDPQLVLQAFLPQLRDLTVTGGSAGHALMSKAGSQLKREYELMEMAGGITGIPFPWAPLNKGTAGMHPEDWIVIYGRPKNMKTWTALFIAVYAYSLGYRVMIYSKEMSKQILIRRAASIICELDYFRIKTGGLNDSDRKLYFEMLASLQDWESSIDSNGKRASLCFIDRRLHGRRGSTVDALAAEAERFEPDLMVVDGFYLMRDGRTNVRSRDWKQISNISSDCKDMAQHLSIPVIGTTQANRGANKTRGDDLDEVAFADAIGQDSDLVARVFKGKSLSTGKPKVMLTFPGTRDSILNPFVINAWPGADFSLLQSTVNVEAFLKDKASSDEEEARQNGQSSGGDGAKRQRRRRRKQSERLRA